MKIAIAQNNYHTGNFEANLTKMLNCIEKAKKEGADMIVFSELAICGYPPRDFLEFDHFIDLCEEAIQQLISSSNGIGIVVGVPERNLTQHGKALYNAAAIIHDGRLLGYSRKALLPTYDVFDEYRYFEPSREIKEWSINGITFTVTICEDLWNIDEPKLYNFTPLENINKEGHSFILNLAASPFSVKQVARRQEVIRKNAIAYQLPVIYVNHVGAQTELIFDGHSMVVDEMGRMVECLACFEEDFKIVDMSALKNYHEIENEISSDKISSLRLEALTLAVKDYFRKQNFTKAILGLSGGIDSALVAYIAAKALGPKNVTALLLPSEFSSDHSIKDAQDLVDNLGIESFIIPIQNPVDSVNESLAEYFHGLPFNIAEENIQSRMRGLLLMAFTNKFGHILLNTSNKSELAVGYGTLYGDMCGGLAVIGDVFKTEVYEMCRFINQFGDIIPDNIILKEPSAELRPNQKDSDSLPDYAVLDKILQNYIDERKSPKEIIGLGFEKALVDRVLKLVNTNEYKRHQTPPIPRISDKAFGQGRRMPIVAKYLS
jgi:NAD+ synthase (glutamine-hydrolysing)